MVAVFELTTPSPTDPMLRLPVNIWDIVALHRKPTQVAARGTTGPPTETATGTVATVENTDVSGMSAPTVTETPTVATVETGNATVTGGNVVAPLLPVAADTLRSTEDAEATPVVLLEAAAPLVLLGTMMLLPQLLLHPQLNLDGRCSVGRPEALAQGRKLSLKCFKLPAFNCS